MAIDKQRITTEQFDEFIQRPEHGDRLFEFIGGEIVEVPRNPYSSKISGWILTFFNMFLLNNPIGHTTGEAGLYRVGDERYAPDVAYISQQRQPELAHEGPNPNPPELAVEVISDEDTAREIDQLTTKISHYLAVGTVVWAVYPKSQLVKIYVSGKPVQVMTVDDVLTTDLLPGFELPIRDIFSN